MGVPFSLNRVINKIRGLVFWYFFRPDVRESRGLFSSKVHKDTVAHTGNKTIVGFPWF